MSKSTLRHTLISISVGLLFLLSLPLAGMGLYWLVTFPDVARLADTNPPSTALMKTRMLQARDEGRLADPEWIWVPLSQIAPDRKSTRLNSSHRTTSYAVFCLKKKNK